MSREAVLLIKWRVGSCKLPFAMNRGGRTSVYQVVGAGTCREAALTTLIERPVYGYLQARSHGCRSAKDQSLSARYLARASLRGDGVDLPN